ncbi:hypothetical protein COCON_G00114180 [Conger conger]|uniref:Uncharacterized protein n=1 Tax=Conger conger TaxID=82655 RepID=A0A9Q1HXZ6_CONCO|nr:hypothetical protein COCON_G00114180 [Conger conger]
MRSCGRWDLHTDLPALSTHSDVSGRKEKALLRPLSLSKPSRDRSRCFSLAVNVAGVRDAAGALCRGGELQALG